MNLKQTQQIYARIDALAKEVTDLQLHVLRLEDIIAPKEIKLKRGPGRPRKVVEQSDG